MIRARQAARGGARGARGQPSTAAGRITPNQRGHALSLGRVHLAWPSAGRPDPAPVPAPTTGAFITMADPAGRTGTARAARCGAGPDPPVEHDNGRPIRG